MIKAVIFDFFDVIRTDPYHAWLTQRGIKRAGEYQEASRESDLGHISLAEFLARISRLSGETVTHDVFTHGAEIDRGVIAIITELKPRYQIGLLSNSTSSLIRELLDKHQLNEYFDQIVVSGEVGVMKPDAKIFHIMLDKLRVAPAEAVFIDDQLHHVEGARAAGLHGIHFTSAVRLGEELVALGVKLPK